MVSALSLCLAEHVIICCLQVVTFPGYQSLYELARSIGCSVSLAEPALGAGAVVEWDISKITVGYKNVWSVLSHAQPQIHLHQLQMYVPACSTDVSHQVMRMVAQDVT